MDYIKKPAKNLLTGAYGLWSVLALILVTIPTLLVLAVLPGESKRRWLVRNAARAVFTLIGARPAVTGLEHLPDSPCVVVANHASYLDGIILTAVLPPRFSFVIKREMTRVPLAHFLLRRIGSQFVERSERRQRATDARRIMKEASQQRSLAFFPEGTFAAEPGLRRFQSGAFLVAARNGAPLVPVTILGSREMLPAHHWLPVPGRLEVIVHEPVRTDTGEPDTAQLIRLARQRILQSLPEPDLLGVDRT
ncbi:MAG TPA: 1-acyl-sn-glycerol-3-phosphate acyltransferase [Chromatiales bacterium]|nr:1-acyl-sn-glycerol-3-phosphate acyltransferase [Chromatiales bacterium]